MKPISTWPTEVHFILIFAILLFGAYLDHLDIKQQECWLRKGELVEGACSVPAAEESSKLTKKEKHDVKVTK